MLHAYLIQGLGCTVRPLLFDFEALNMRQIKSLMSVKKDDTQLYMGVILSILKKYQIADKMVRFEKLVKEIEEV